MFYIFFDKVQHRETKKTPYPWRICSRKGCLKTLPLVNLVQVCFILFFAFCFIFYGMDSTDFQAARPLWNSEVKIILQHAQAMRAKEEKSPSGVLERSLVYAAQFDLFGSKENTEGARR